MLLAPFLRGPLLDEVVRIREAHHEARHPQLFGRSDVRRVDVGEGERPAAAGAGIAQADAAGPIAAPVAA